jgi:excinuclease UvrABC nuclease subunit
MNDQQIPWWDDKIDCKLFTVFSQPCVYGWFRGNKCLYIGSSFKGMQRLFAHMVVGKYENFQPGDEIKFVWCTHITEARILEPKIIERYKPKYNSAHNGQYKPSLLVEREQNEKSK